MDYMEPKPKKNVAGPAKGEVSSAQTPDIELRDINSGGTMSTKTNTLIFVVYLVLIVMGVGTGYLLSGKSGFVLGTINQKPGMIKTDKVVGSTDAKTFKDSAVGVIQKGGIDGEGTHQLIRDGGPSQTAFLISSVIDLDQYVGKKVKVWGETFAAKRAAWLMDVGKVELQ